MLCKNCGNQLREGEKFCTVCGTYNDPDDIDDSLDENAVPLENQLNEFELKGKSVEQPKEKKKKKKKKKPVREEVVREDDPYVVAYIGEDYKWIAERPFNIYALLLSWIYFLYRKMYLIGILGLILTGFIIKVFPDIIIPYIVLVMLGTGIFFNKIYLDTVNRKVKKIEKNAKNLDNIESICRKKGGVNVFVPLLVFFIFLIVMLLSYVNISIPFFRTSKYQNENNLNKANCKSIGIQVYEDINKKERIGDLEEFVCEIDLGPKKLYDLYYKLNYNGSTRYIYFEDTVSEEYLLKADTDYIDELEQTQKEFDLTDSDKDFLQQSRELKNKYSSLKDESDYEDTLIKKDKEIKEKTHFIFTKDDIYK